ncbi:CHAT domain-containing protein [Micromonospora sp. NPDC048935]|uniref:CHAT domain-containing protein n=1 Tax=Micromonospora sp. NPDC048935 TaxID=3364262 RepID=UPI0037103A0B
MMISEQERVAETTRQLRHYAGEDRRIAALPSILDVILAVQRFGPIEALGHVWGALESRRELRAARTTRQRLGSFHADAVRPLVRSALRPLRWRLTVATAIAATFGAARWPLDRWAAAQVGLVALTVLLVGRRDPRAVVGLIAVAVIAVVVDVQGWWACVLGVYAAWMLISYGALGPLRAAPWWAQGPVLGMIPRRLRLRLAITGRSEPLANAVDLATSSRAQLAEPFVAACTAMPESLQPMIRVCSALIAFDKGDIDTALSLASEATEWTVATPDTVKGWCLAQLAMILEQTGAASAPQVRATASSLLRARSCRRYARRLELIEAQRCIAEAPVEKALDIVHDYRLLAVRLRDFDVLQTTEMWMARLMIRQGLPHDAARVLESRVGGEDGRIGLFDARDETADDLLLRASVQIGRLSEAHTDPRRDVVAALAMIDADSRPLAATTGRRLLAKLDQAAGEPERALAYAASALVAAQHGRYMLPSARWRESWSRTQLDAHATMLALASASGDSPLVAEVIELARGEALPAATDVDSLSAMAALDAAAAGSHSRDRPATVTGPTADSTDAMAVLQGLNPVRQPPRVRVGSGLRLPRLDDSAAEIALDQELTAIGPCTWYWSAATVLDDCYWAVRDPGGEWSQGRIPLGAGTPAAEAYKALLAALPFALPGESTDGVREKLRAGALGPAASQEAERQILARVAAAFLPAPLADGLRQSTDATLVVSLPTALGHLPVAGFPLGPGTDLRVVDRAAVIHMPSWAVIHARPRSGSADRPDSWPARLAIAAPHGEADMEILTRPDGVDRVVRGPLSLNDCRNLLHAHDDHQAWVLTLIGHVGAEADDAEAGNVARSGLQLGPNGRGGNERLTMIDLVPPDGSEHRLALPERVVLIGCGSIGIGSAPDLVSGQTPTGEWLGLGAAVVLAGASHVCCTLYTVHANKHMKRITDGLIQGFSSSPDPVSALRRVQLGELQRWRADRSTYPAAWLSLAYVGVGWER